MKVVYPIEWDERDLVERPAKGWLSDVVVQTDNGEKFSLSFYDPVRLVQEIQSDLSAGKSGFIEPGLIVVAQVTKEHIEKAIVQAEAEGYFERV